MNTAFRDTIFILDLTLFRGYRIALVIMFLAANVLNDMGVVRLYPRPFFPVANSRGCFLCGLGMVLGGLAAGMASAPVRAQLREAELLVDIGYRESDSDSIQAGRAIVDHVLGE